MTDEQEGLCFYAAHGECDPAPGQCAECAPKVLRELDADERWERSQRQLLAGLDGLGECIDRMQALITEARAIVTGGR